MLKALLAQHGIAVTCQPITVLNKPGSTQSTSYPEIPLTAGQQSRHLSPEEKVKLFRRLFHGREDAYPIRWESAQSGKTGYSPVCANEWRPGICEKPRIKCAECKNSLYLPVTD